jgi:CBS domain-containing protein
MLVRDIATTTLKTATPEFAIRQIRDLLENNDFRHVPVVDTAGSGVVGLVSTRDLAASASMAREFGGDRAAYEAFLDQSVSSFLKTRFGKERDIIVVGPDEPVEYAAELLVEHQLSALPVVDENGELFGLVSYVDLLEAGFGLGQA